MQKSVLCSRATEPRASSCTYAPLLPTLEGRAYQTASDWCPGMWTTYKPPGSSQGLRQYEPLAILLLGSQPAASAALQGSAKQGTSTTPACPHCSRSISPSQVQIQLHMPHIACKPKYFTGHPFCNGPEDSQLSPTQKQGFGGLQPQFCRFSEPGRHADAACT